MLFSLQEKHILVTGASSGIGKAIALCLSKQGAKLIITGRNASRLQETFNALEGSAHVQCISDVTDKTSLEALVTSLPPLQGVVFCAGVIDYMPAKQINAEAMQHVMETNFNSQILLYQALHLQKKLSKGASLVFISSVSAQTAVPATLSYAASKAALNAGVRVLASELAKFKIRVNSVSPGLVETPLLAHENMDADSLKQNEANYPLGLGKPEDVAYTVCFLLSDEARWITGIDMVIDGGYLLHT